MNGNYPPTDGKHIATVKIGPKGQIVIPKAVRDMFGVGPGDTFLLLADIQQGIALVKNDQYKNFAQEILNAQNHPVEDE